MSDIEPTPSGSTPSSPAIPRRRFVKGFAGVVGAAVVGSLAGKGASSSLSTAADLMSMQSSSGKYRLDLGGYDGPELSSKPIHLRFMRQSYTPAVEALFTKMYKNFTTAYPNVTISQELVPYGNLTTKLQVYVASGNAPDIMMGRNDFTLAYNAGNISLPLNQYFTKEFLNQTNSRLLAAATVDGKVLCIPWEDNVRVLNFNYDIFKLAGVETPPVTASLATGWTIEQMIDAMREITKKLRSSSKYEAYWALESSTFGNGGPGSNYTQNESTWVRQMGTKTAKPGSEAYNTWAGVSPDGFTATGYLDTDLAIEGMKHYQTFFSEGLTPKGIVANQYNSGFAALSVGGINPINAWQAPGAAKPNFTPGTTLIPRGNTLFGCNSSDSPIIWAKTPNPDAATALVGYMLNIPNRVQFHTLWGSQPASNAVLAAMPVYKTGKGQQLSVKTGNISDPAPRSVGWFDYFNAINPAVANIALGADPATTLHNTAAQIDRLLAKYR